jgi:hypothetical protein
VEGKLGRERGGGGGEDEDEDDVDSWGLWQAGLRIEEGFRFHHHQNRPN